MSILPNLRISFEIEAFVNKEDDLARLLGEIQRTDLLGASCGELLVSIPSAVLDHLEYLSGHSGWREDENEGSINIEENECYDKFVSFELIPPILAYDSGIKCLRSVFDFFRNAGIETNSSCGLHVNISYDGIEDLDPYNLISYLNEEEILKEFDRLNCGYCAPFGTWVFRREQMTKFLSGDSVEQKKNCSVNFDKLVDGYLEFRMIGGANYHTKESVFWAIDNYIRALYTEYQNRKGI